MIDGLNSVATAGVAAELTSWANEIASVHPSTRLAINAIRLNQLAPDKRPLNKQLTTLAAELMTK